MIRWILALMLTGMLAVATAGCGGGETPPADTEPPAQQQPTDGADDLDDLDTTDDDTGM